MKVLELKFHLKENSNIFHRDIKKSLEWVGIKGSEEIWIAFVLGDVVQMASFVGQFQTPSNLYGEAIIFRNLLHTCMLLMAEGHTKNWICYIKVFIPIF